MARDFMFLFTFIVFVPKFIVRSILQRSRFDSLCVIHIPFAEIFLGKQLVRTMVLLSAGAWQSFNMMMVTTNYII
jgi:hypothetical protein